MKCGVKEMEIKAELIQEKANKAWADYQDIMDLTGCSNVKAHEIMRDIKSQSLKEGKLVQRSYVPMWRVLEKLDIKAR